MVHGRGPAPDSLPPAEALAVRSLLREARDVKGLNNADLAKQLGWKPGQRAANWSPARVARVLDLTGSRDKRKTPRPLRASNAVEVIRAINSAAARAPDVRNATREALLATVEALRSSRLLARYGQPELAPQVLMWPDDQALREFAEFLSDRMPRQRRERLVDDLFRALRDGCHELAESAAAVYATKFRGSERQQRERAELLRSFGYSPRSRNARRE